MTSWRIRDFHADDLDGILGLWEEIKASRAEPVYGLSEVLASCQKDHAVVAVHGDQVIGAAVGRAAHAQGWIVFLATTESWQSQGIGTALLAALERRMAPAGLTKLSALMPETPTRVDAFLNRGFEVKKNLRYFERHIPVQREELKSLSELGGRVLPRDLWAFVGGMAQQVVSKAKFSEFREPEDHVHLVETSLAKGELKSVPAIIRDLAKSLSGLKKTAACRAIASAMFHRHNGDKEQASEELEVALLACKESIGLSNDTKMMLAKNCLESGLEQGVVEVMTSVVGNAPTSVAMSSAMRLLHEGGREDLVKRITQASKSEVVDMVSAGAEKARLGDFQGAVTLMSEAAEKLPHNPQVVFNAAVAALKCLDNLGWDMQLGERARRYVADARRLDPRNPRLSLLTGMYRDILKKYKISGVDDIPTMPTANSEDAKDVIAK